MMINFVDFCRFLDKRFTQNSVACTSAVLKWPMFHASFLKYQFLFNKEMKRHHFLGQKFQERKVHVQRNLASFAEDLGWQAVIQAVWAK
jgi:hypothetical protein